MFLYNKTKRISFQNNLSFCWFEKWSGKPETLHRLKSSMIYRNEQQCESNRSIKRCILSLTVGPLILMFNKNLLAVVVAQLVERSLPIPEVYGLNPVSSENLNWIFTVNCFEKTKIKKKRGRNWPIVFFKKESLNSEWS